MTTIMTRKAAAAAGLKHYFTGKPCVHGHLVARFVSTGGCIECARGYQRAFVQNMRQSAVARGDRSQFQLLPPNIRVHPEDHESVFALIDYLNQQRGGPPCPRPATPATAAPVDTRTAWEWAYDMHRRTKPHHLAVLFATQPDRPETHSPGWSNPGWEAEPPAAPTVSLGGAAPEYLK